jgi:riboflavin biosynthesis pyrimidine reductase
MYWKKNQLKAKGNKIKKAKLGLIDEFLLFINPFAIGNGMAIFKDLNEIQEFNLVKSIAFDSGEILLHYETRKA